MAGKPQRSGGKREGAGRKPAPLAKVGFYCQLPLETRDAIRRLAAEREMSQSEIVDMWRRFWEEQQSWIGELEVETAMKEESK